MILPSGYILSEFFVRFKIIDRTNDIGPTLPMNISKQSISLDKEDNCEVMPVESPTVANADTVSNNIDSSEMFVCISDKLIITDETNIKNIAENAIAVALYTVFLFNLCLLIVVSVCPAKTLITVDIITAIVVVLIPPPVEEGEAPINISIIVMIFVISYSWSIGTEKKPAVLHSTD